MTARSPVRAVSRSPARIPDEVGGPLPLPRWEAAKARVLAGDGNAVVMVYGDSTVNGSGAGGEGYVAGGREENWIVQLAALLNGRGVPARADGLVGRGNRTTWMTFDPRIALTNWVQVDNVTLAGVIGKTITSNTDAATNDFTPNSEWDRAEFVYAISATQGSFSLAVDSGELLATVSASGANALGRQTVSAPDVGEHTLNIAKVGASRVHQIMVRTWDSTTSEVEFVQAGYSGAGVTEFTVATSPWDALNFIAAQPCDLAIVCLTIHDWNALTDLATYKTKLAQIVTAAQSAGGDVIVMSGVPSNPATDAALAEQQIYVDAARQVAEAHGGRFLDVWSRWGDWAGPNAAGWYSDDLHPSTLGYADIAAAIDEVL